MHLSDKVMRFSCILLPFLSDLFILPCRNLDKRWLKCSVALLWNLIKNIKILIKKLTYFLESSFRILISMNMSKNFIKWKFAVVHVFRLFEKGFNLLSYWSERFNFCSFFLTFVSWCKLFFVFILNFFF